MLAAVVGSRHRTLPSGQHVAAEPATLRREARSLDPAPMPTSTEPPTAAPGPRAQAAKGVKGAKGLTGVKGAADVPSAARPATPKRPPDARPVGAETASMPAPTPPAILHEWSGPLPPAGLPLPPVGVRLPPAGVPLPASATFETGAPFAAVAAGDALAGNGSGASSQWMQAAPAKDAGTPKPGQASLLADLPIDAPEDLPGWLVAIGSALVIVSFFLPWSTAGRTLIGDTTLELNPGYIDSWGLAIPSSLLLVLIGLAMLVLTIWPNRIPGWIRGGVMPIVCGGLFLGIDWTYTSTSSTFGGGIGLVVLLAGAAFLVAGGSLEVRPRRHGPSEPGV